MTTKLDEKNCFSESLKMKIEVENHGKMENNRSLSRSNGFNPYNHRVSSSPNSNSKPNNN